MLIFLIFWEIPIVNYNGDFPKSPKIQGKSALSKTKTKISPWQIKIFDLTFFLLEGMVFFFDFQPFPEVGDEYNQNGGIFISIDLPLMQYLKQPPSCRIPMEYRGISILEHDEK